MATEQNTPQETELEMRDRVQTLLFANIRSLGVSPEVEELLQRAEFESVHRRPNTLLPQGEDESKLTPEEREDTEAGQRAVLNGLTLAEHLDAGGEDAWKSFAEAAERTARFAAALKE